jgi:hypothetical protein
MSYRFELSALFYQSFGISSREHTPNFRPNCTNNFITDLTSYFLLKMKRMVPHLFCECINCEFEFIGIVANY